MSLLNQLFNRGVFGTKCKTCLSLTIPRIKLLQNKRDLQTKHMRKEIAQFLHAAEHVIREQNIWASYGILELFCESILARVPIIESQRDCPTELREAIASIIFAAPRCSDIPDLLQTRNLFAAKYGKEFVLVVSELRPDSGVNRTIIEKPSVSAPSGDLKLKVLKEIAREFNLVWDSSDAEADLCKRPEDLLAHQIRTEDISTEPYRLRKSKRLSSPSNKEVEGQKSSRQMKRGLRQIVDEPVDEDQSTHDPTYEPQSTSNRDEDEEHSVGISSRKIKAPKKSKKPLSGNDKPAPKRKNSKKANDESTKEPPRQKFSNSSRRNKRTADKALLDIPEDEIDTQRLPIKDLILLAEHREKMMIKDAAAKLKTGQNIQSADGSLHEDGAHNEEEGLSEHGQNSDEDQPRYESTSLYVNYQTYMNKTPTSRWSKLDTLLFYEAVRQFGTDFSVIQQLFPNRTHHQIKLKFKSEEHQHPHRLSEAAINRVKDHSYFEFVIERLKQASASKHESFGQDSVAITEEEEAEDIARDTNDGATKPEQDDETMTEQEADVVEVQNSPLKSYESDGDDDLDRWNQYNY